MLANIDNNVWGLLAVPVGILLGFGPAILAWLWMSRSPGDKPGGRATRELEE
jgi:hypothetical protein